MKQYEELQKFFKDTFGIIDCFTDKISSYATSVFGYIVPG